MLKKISIFKQCLKSQNGSTTIIGLVLISASVLTLIHLTSKSNLEMNSTLRVTTKFKAKVINTFVDFKMAQPGFINELRDPTNAPNNRSSMGCSMDAAPCLAFKDQKVPIRYVYYSDGNLWMDLSNPATGITENGVVCNTFNLPNGQNCKYRLELMWTPDCQNPGCTVYDDVYTGVVFSVSTSGRVVVKDERKYEISQSP